MTAQERAVIAAAQTWADIFRAWGRPSQDAAPGNRYRQELLLKRAELDLLDAVLELRLREAEKVR